jgi:hypothetical protein
MMEAFCNARRPGWGSGAIGRLPSSSLVQLSDVGNLNPSLLPESPKMRVGGGDMPVVIT